MLLVRFPDLWTSHAVALNEPFVGASSLCERVCDLANRIYSVVARISQQSLRIPNCKNVWPRKCDSIVIPPDDHFNQFSSPVQGTDCTAPYQAPLKLH